MRARRSPSIALVLTAACWFAAVPCRADGTGGSAPTPQPAAPAAPIGEEVDRWIHLFESPDRELWQRPSQVVAALLLRPGMKVADIGAGSGYFTRKLALDVGPTGTVWAVDIEPGMLRYIQKTAQQAGLTNLVTILASPDDPMLPPGQSDLIFICNTLHHIRDRVAYLRLLKRYLAPGGKLVILDYYREELPIGPPPELKLRRETVLEEAARAGFVLRTEHLFLPYQYFLVFVRG